MHRKPGSALRTLATQAVEPLQPPTAEAAAAAAGSKVAIFVEPSPFSHVSGMKNRFLCLINGLRDQGDDVLVVTPDGAAPQEFNGAKVSQRAAIAAVSRQIEQGGSCSC
jgi:hypothetical protein